MRIETVRTFVKCVLIRTKGSRRPVKVGESIGIEGLGTIRITDTTPRGTHWVIRGELDFNPNGSIRDQMKHLRAGGSLVGDTERRWWKV